MVNATGIDIRVVGLKDTTRFIKNFNRDAKWVVRNRPYSLAAGLAKEMRRSVPVRTGHLKENIYVIGERGGRVRIETRTYKSYPRTGRKHGYAAYVEAGYPAPRTRGSIVEKPLRKFPQLFKTHIVKPIDRALQRR